MKYQTERARLKPAGSSSFDEGVEVNIPFTGQEADQGYRCSSRSIDFRFRSIYDDQTMAVFPMTRATSSSVRVPSSEDVAVAHVARNAAVSTAMARTFAQISAPENKKLFSAQAARKAFSRVKVTL